MEISLYIMLSIKWYIALVKIRDLQALTSPKKRDWSTGFFMMTFTTHINGPLRPNVKFGPIIRQSHIKHWSSNLWRHIKNERIKRNRKPRSIQSCYAQQNIKRNLSTLGLREVYIRHRICLQEYIDTLTVPFPYRK